MQRDFAMTPSDFTRIPAGGANQFNLFGGSDRDPSLAGIGVRLSECYGSIPSEVIPERFVRLLERLGVSAPLAT